MPQAERDDANPRPVLDALVDALLPDPFYLAISDDCTADDAARRAVLRHYFDYSLSEGARIGQRVLADGAVPAAAIWHLPLDEQRAAMEAQSKSQFLCCALGPLGKRNYDRIIEFMTPRAQAVVPARAWYLSIVGVAPALQGQGIGARLLLPTLAMADAAHAACYLETFTPRNLAFYRRLGFTVVAEPLEPVTGTRYLVMLRAAR